MTQDALASVEEAILAEVTREATENGIAPTARVIKAVSKTQSPAVVRAAYWQLISEMRICRSANGQLTVRS